MTPFGISPIVKTVQFSKAFFLLAFPVSACSGAGNTTPELG